MELLSLQRLPVRNLVLNQAKESRSILDRDILSRFRVTIDARRKKLVAGPIQAWIDRNKMVPGLVAVSVARDKNGEIVVTRVAEAYKDLLGGQVIGIDNIVVRGKPLKDFPLALIQNVLDGYAGTEVSITVRSHGQESKVSLKRVALSEFGKQNGNE